MAFTALEKQDILYIEGVLRPLAETYKTTVAASPWKRDRRRVKKERKVVEKQFIAKLEAEKIEVYETASGMTAILIALKLLEPILRPIVEAAIKKLLDDIFN